MRLATARRPKDPVEIARIEHEKREYAARLLAYRAALAEQPLRVSIAAQPTREGFVGNVLDRTTYTDSDLLDFARALLASRGLDASDATLRAAFANWLGEREVRRVHNWREATAPLIGAKFQIQPGQFGTIATVEGIHTDHITGRISYDVLDTNAGRWRITATRGLDDARSAGVPEGLFAISGETFDGKFTLHIEL